MKTRIGILGLGGVGGYFGGTFSESILQILMMLRNHIYC